LQSKIEIFGKDNSKIALDYINIGSSYNEKGNNKIALTNYLKAIELLGSKKSEMLAGAYINIGNIHKEENQNTTALDYYKKAIGRVSWISDSAYL